MINNWSTVYNTSKKHIIHFFDHHNLMVVTNLEKGYSTIVDLENSESTRKVDISTYSIEQYIDLLLSVSELDRDYDSKLG